MGSVVAGGRAAGPGPQQRPSQPRRSSSVCLSPGFKLSRVVEMRATGFELMFEPSAEQIAPYSAPCEADSDSSLCAYPDMILRFLPLEDLNPGGVRQCATAVSSPSDRLARRHVNESTVCSLIYSRAGSDQTDVNSLGLPLRAHFTVTCSAR